MNPILKIKNIGPLKDIELEINKVNVFIGPQSSGKSTIAKIISFCQWLEKDILMHQGQNHIDQAYWEKNLFTYHKIASYFDSTSFIQYAGNLVSFTFHTPQDYQISITGDLSKEKMSKITYIPSERNYVAIPNISTLSMEANYIRDFIFDWLLIRNRYSKETPQNVIGLGVQYYFDKNRGDVITLDNGKDISLNEASSGLQAVIPLLVSLSYSTEWIYNHNQDLSFEKYRLLQEILKESDIENINRLGKPHSTFMIIEEPEENLFPSTQYELIKYIFSFINSRDENAVVLTTHSPYIMTSINNLIQAGNVITDYEINKERVSPIIGNNTFIRYEDVNAMAIQNGYIYSIKDDEYQLISATALDTASEIINQDFEKLLDL